MLLPIPNTNSSSPHAPATHEACRNDCSIKNAVPETIGKNSVPATESPKFQNEAAADNAPSSPDKKTANESAGQLPSSHDLLEKILENEPGESIPPQTKSEPEKISGFNYASLEAGASILASSANTKEAHTILSRDDDKYMRMPSRDEKWFVVQLSEDIVVEQFEITNREHYSSGPKRLLVYGSAKWPVESWRLFGQFEALDNHRRQRFVFEKSFWARFLMVEIQSIHRNEFFCTITQFNVYGSTIIEKFHEEMEQSTKEVVIAREEMALNSKETREVSPKTKSDKVEKVIEIKPTQPSFGFYANLIKEFEKSAWGHCPNPHWNEKSNFAEDGTNGFVSEISFEEMKSGPLLAAHRSCLQQFNVDGEWAAMQDNEAGLFWKCVLTTSKDVSDKMNVVFRDAFTCLAGWHGDIAANSNDKKGQEAYKIIAVKNAKNTMAPVNVNETVHDATSRSKKGGERPKGDTARAVSADREAVVREGPRGSDNIFKSLLDRIKQIEINDARLVMFKNDAEKRMSRAEERLSELEEKLDLCGDQLKKLNVVKGDVYEKIVEVWRRLNDLSQFLIFAASVICLAVSIALLFKGGDIFYLRTFTIFFFLARFLDQYNWQ